MTQRLVIALVPLLVVLAACGGDDDSDTSAGDGADSSTESAAAGGVLAIDAGTCDGEAPTGSWFRMVQPGGELEAGPFVDNPDSTCADQSVTVLSPGTDGGILLDGYQPQPDPVFDDGGGSLAAAIIRPTRFFAVDFGVSTNEVDPQTGTSVPAPSATVDGDEVTADLRAFAVSWNGQHFNQGAPSPAGEGPPATGTVDPESGAYVLEWATTIVGGPFNGFTGIWHLEGTLEG